MISKIREFNLKDTSSIIDLFDELQKAENEADPNRKVGKATAKIYFEKTLKELKRKNGKFFVAELDKLIIGLLVCFIERNDIIETSGLHLYIADIVIKKEHRRKQFGFELLKEAETYARKNKIPEIRINSLFKNSSALRFYKKANFKEKEILLCKFIVL